MAALAIRSGCEWITIEIYPVRGGALAAFAAGGGVLREVVKIKKWP